MAVRDFTLNEIFGEKKQKTSKPAIKKPKNRVLIFVEGGVIKNIITDNKDMDVFVMDCDTEGSDEYQTYRDLEGNNFDAIDSFDKKAITVNTKIVDHYFGQRE